jgi:HSP20 family protein
MNLIPWRRRESLTPFLTDFDDFFRSMWSDDDGERMTRLPEVFRKATFPAVNVSETEDSFCVTVDCPGLDEEDLSVTAMGNNLVISGERKWEEEKKGKEYRRIESQYGKFERTLPLPENVRLDVEKVDASYKKGVLTVTVPKLEKTPTAKIPVHAG